jgi:hypothetical protein
VPSNRMQGDTGTLIAGEGKKAILFIYIKTL